MSTPIYYSYTDSGAPQIKGNTRSSMHDVMYACLCTGYGEKAAAGWTRPYVNGTHDISVFRNDTVSGTGFYIQIDCNTTQSNYGSVQGYEVMTSETIGLFPFKATNFTIRTSNAINDTVNRPWVLIADSRAFYFLCWFSISTYPTDSNYSTSGIFFGDIEARTPSDAYACALSAYDSNSLYILLSNTSTSVGSSWSMPRKADGSSGSIVPAFIFNGGPCSAYPGNLGLSYTTNDPIILSRPYLNDAATYTFRGYVPGLHVPCHSLRFSQLTIYTIDSIDYLSLRYITSPSICNLLISLSNWRT